MKGRSTIDRSTWPRECPRPPESEDDLLFRQEKMVDWLGPKQLASTGIQAALSAIFGSYADKREMQAALHPGVSAGEALYDRDYNKTATDDFWLDYCADLGDGFRSTFAMAWLLSRQALPIPGEHALQRGKLLVLGGDQVYPTATRDEYDNRFVGPYNAALPWAEEPNNPELFAIPGNHDWYDGLTSFLRLFCQGRWIGGWRTLQTRSYFAIRLPHNWWIWGTDLQLGTDVDQPQLAYFRNVAEQMRVDAGAARPRLILCTAQPSWVHCDARPDSPRGCRYPVDPAAYASLDFLERDIIARKGIHLAAILSGDLHHYMHYREVTGKADGEAHLVTSGGGGAYLYPTHHMPERLSITARRKTGEEQRTFVRECAFPNDADSRRAGRWGWFHLPWRNRGFSTFIALLYLLYAWMIQSASKRGTTLFDWWAGIARTRGLPDAVPTSLMDLLAILGPADWQLVVRAYWDVLRHSPANVLFAVALVMALVTFRTTEQRVSWHGLGGATHGALHLLLCFMLIWVSSCLNLRGLKLDVDDLLQVALFSGETFVVGGLLGGWMFGLYLLACSKWTGAHINEVYSSRSLTSFKNFLRLHIGSDGSLTIHAIGVRNTPELGRYTYRGADATLQPGESWFRPPDDTMAYERIERIDIRNPQESAR